VLKDYPGSMSIGGNSIFDSSVNIDSQLAGKASGSGKSQMRYPEWSGNHLLRARKGVGCLISLGYVPLGSEMSSMLLYKWHGRFCYNYG
jgi:hypothetical protein